MCKNTYCQCFSFVMSSVACFVSDANNVLLEFPLIKCLVGHILLYQLGDTLGRQCIFHCLFGLILVIVSFSIVVDKLACNKLIYLNKIRSYFLVKNNGRLVLTLWNAGITKAVK